MTSAQGMDLSAYQPHLTSTGGKDFVVVKATEGTSYTDPHFAANWAYLARQPVRRGAYHFFHPGLDVLEQVALFFGTVAAHGLRPGDMLIADVEISAGLDGEITFAATDRRSHLLYTDPAGATRIRDGASYPHRLFRPTQPRKTDYALTGTAAASFLGGVHNSVAAALGGNYCRVLCYTFSAMLGQLSACTAFPLYIAAWGTQAPVSVHPWDTWTLWQWSNGGGPGGADQDAYNGTPAELNIWAGAIQPDPQPAPVPAWETRMLNALPILMEGDSDKPGKVSFVRRAQALASVIGTVNNLPAAKGLLIDGNFGPATTAAVKAVQAFFRITQDGQVGPQTWSVLVTGAPD